MDARSSEVVERLHVLFAERRAGRSGPLLETVPLGIVVEVPGVPVVRDLGHYGRLCCGGGGGPRAIGAEGGQQARERRNPWPRADGW